MKKRALTRVFTNEKSVILLNDSFLSRPRRLARPRTPPFHGDNTGSNPVGDANNPNSAAANQIRLIRCAVAECLWVQSLIFIQIFFRHVVFGNFASVDFALVIVVRVLDAADHPCLECIALFE